MAEFHMNKKMYQMNFNYFVIIRNCKILQIHTLLLLIFLIHGCKQAPNEINKPALINETNLSEEEAINKKVNTKAKVDLIESHFCKQDELSHQFDLVHHFKKYRSKSNKSNSSISLIYLANKNNGEYLDSISCSLIPRENISCNNNVSFSTNYNTSIECEDGHCGDIIIADLNFDGLDDIAIADHYIASSILYSFYLQSKGRKFVKSDYLSDTIGYFPSDISKRDCTLTTVKLDSYSSFKTTVYKFIVDENRWVEL
jgi:hypothetical protein